MLDIIIIIIVIIGKSSDDSSQYVSSLHREATTGKNQELGKKCINLNNKVIFNNNHLVQYLKGWNFKI